MYLSRYLSVYPSRQKPQHQYVSIPYFLCVCVRVCMCVEGGWHKHICCTYSHITSHFWERIWQTILNTNLVNNIGLIWQMCIHRRDKFLSATLVYNEQAVMFGLFPSLLLCCCIPRACNQAGIEHFYFTVCGTIHSKNL